MIKVPPRHVKYGNIELSNSEIAFNDHYLNVATNFAFNIPTRCNVMILPHLRYSKAVSSFMVEDIVVKNNTFITLTTGCVIPYYLLDKVHQYKLFIL
jgi:hypothetical protein